MTITRRGFLIKSAVGLLAAPAIVKVYANLMPVRAWTPAPDYGTVVLTPFQQHDHTAGPNFLGLAQLKAEGTPVLFDPGAPTTVPAGERIYTGDMVTVHNGKAYRSGPVNPITHVAITSSNLRD